MYRNLDGRLGVEFSANTALSRRGAKARVWSGLAAAAVCFSAVSAWGATVDIRCPRLTDSAKGELEARARLFLTSADMEGAAIAVECDATTAALVWTDGS